MRDYKKEIECAASALKGETPIIASTEEKALALDRAVMALNHLIRHNITTTEFLDSIIKKVPDEGKHLFLLRKERYSSYLRAYAYVRDMLVCFQKFASEGLDTEKHEDTVKELYELYTESEKDTEELKVLHEWYRSAFLPCELPVGNKNS